ncbi:MAG: TetR/AcrR family transcriptional regulator C-terminal domain-containing protein [Eubacterium sp.]|nr:TetR/AcrR family transcriptional regulator C-terminal domain-containing protein [Eubacterium sp.]
MIDSNITKTSIAEALKLLCHGKGFEKITIKDISEKCGINRQTFYYHFHDKYDLLEWIYKTELIDKYTLNISFENWPERFRLLLTDMKNNKTFYINTITHTEDYMKSSMIFQAQQIFEQAIDSLDETNKVNKKERDFITKFFAYGVCGTIIEWAESGMESSPEEICRNMTSMRDLCEKAAYNFINDNLSK